MTNKLFNQTFKVYREFTGTKGTALGEPLNYVHFTKKKLNKIDKLFQELFNILEKECSKNKYVTEKSAKVYFKSWYKKAKSSNVCSLLDYMVGDMFYFSDRWGYERYKTIEWAWALIRPEIESWLNH